MDITHAPWRTLPLPNPQPVCLFSSPCHGRELPLPQAGASHRPSDCWAASMIWPQDLLVHLSRGLLTHSHHVTKTGTLQRSLDPRTLQWSPLYCQQWKQASLLSDWTVFQSLTSLHNTYLRSSQPLQTAFRFKVPSGEGKPMPIPRVWDVHFWSAAAGSCSWPTPSGTSEQTKYFSSPGQHRLDHFHEICFSGSDTHLQQLVYTGSELSRPGSTPISTSNLLCDLRWVTTFVNLSLTFIEHQNSCKESNT